MFRLRSTTGFDTAQQLVLFFFPEKRTFNKKATHPGGSDKTESQTYLTDCLMGCNLALTNG